LRDFIIVTDRYDISVDEGFEPRSNDVLKNYLSIKSKNEMNVVEEQELKRTELELLSLFDENHQFTEEDLCNIHELWLGDIYPFAGKYRSVNMSKNNFPFAVSARIPQLMENFEINFLKKYTPCLFEDTVELADALGRVHVEFIIIHPFREGNGRTARLLADLMAMQAKRPPLNYALIEQNKNMQQFNKYILAIHAGFDGNYKLIGDIFQRLLDDSFID